LGCGKICILETLIPFIKELMMGTKEKISEELLLEEEALKQNEIVLFNDEVNTFDHVIDTLVAVCEHTPEQAEQCSLIVHYNGKCTVKTGEYTDLEPRCSRLLQAGLSAEIV
jgi:ATP-dependent Clp protease adaptor protein ClpS